MNCKSKKLLTVIMTVAMAFCMLFAFGTFSASADEIETPVAPEKTTYTFDMNEGVSTKVEGFIDVSIKNAIRFTTTLKAADVQSDMANFDVKVKTIIVKTEELGSEVFTKENLEAKGINYQQVIFSEDVNMPAVNEDGNYVFNACLYNVKDENFTKEFSAISYIEINGKATQYTENFESGSLWDVANAHKATLDKDNDGVVDNESEDKDEYDFVSTLCKTYNVTVTSGLDSSKEQTITVKHGQKLDAYIESLSTVTAPVVGVSYFDCFVDGEDAVYSDIVTSDLTLTAKYSTIAYGYDATKDVYYVADNKAFKGDTVIIPATYNDGVHEEKAVKYVADEAFETNTNIKKVILPESVIVVGHSSFNNCTSLTYMAMPGVQAVAYESRFYGYKDGYEKITIGGTNTFLNAPIETLIVNSQFEVQGQQFASNIGQELRIRVYSLSTTPAEWTGDRASNCVLRTGENSGFDKSFEAPYTSPVCYYSEGFPSTTYSNYMFWHYDEKGEPAIWGAKDYIETQGVNYNYDADDNCYYITYSPNVTVEHLVIPEKWNDGIHGEAYVKYLANIYTNGAEQGAFKNNTILKSVILPDSVVIMNGEAFYGCTNLEYVVMRGVKKLLYGEANRNTAGLTFTKTNTTAQDGADLSFFGLTSMFGVHKGYNFYNCTSLKYLVVGDGFWDRGSQRDNFSADANVKIYVYGSTTAKFDSGCQGTFTVSTYSESDLMDGLAHWYYEDGSIKEWPVLEMTDEQGVLYGYDTANDCYYVSDNKALITAKITIPATFNDGVRGEKAVKYVADNAFNNNDNITHVYLNVSITELGHQAFYDCSNLAHIEMPGVAIIRGSGAKTGYEGIVEANPRSTFRHCSSLTVMVVPANFEIQEQHVVDTNRDVRVYSLSTVGAEWKTDRADNCTLRTGDAVNNAFINTCEEGKLSPVYYYSEEEPTDTNYTFWCYNEDGSIKVWGAVAE